MVKTAEFANKPGLINQHPILNRTSYFQLLVFVMTLISVLPVDHVSVQTNIVLFESILPLKLGIPAIVMIPSLEMVKLPVNECMYGTSAFLGCGEK
jgi:hypothetical protein